MIVDVDESRQLPPTTPPGLPLKKVVAASNLRAWIEALVAVAESDGVVGFELHPDAPPCIILIVPVDQTMVYGPGVT